MKAPVVATGALLVIAIAGGCGRFKEEQVTARVIKTERACFKGRDRARDCRNMVYTDKEQFEVTDTFSRRDSADVYGRIEQGKTYEFTVIGYRNPSTSSFRNILQARLR